MHQVLRARFRLFSSICLRGRLAHATVFSKRPELLQATPPWQNGFRQISLASIPAALLPPVVFGGLLITLWTYKCLMMIIFQNRIIYMPSMPPFSRSEKVADFANECKPVLWQDHPIKSTDGTKLRLLEGSVPEEEHDTRRDHVVVVYFQGNASSLPPRLPYLSNILKQLHAQSKAKFTFVALSYRGFWTSSGRPSQRGIELDAQATLDWISKRYGQDEHTRVVIYGQSIGAGVATTATATWLTHRHNDKPNNHIRISGVLLETPFTSLREMLVSLYPQKFLPYRYLGPFLVSTWDSRVALRSIGETLDMASHRQRLPNSAVDCIKIMLLEAGNDELVPEGNAALLLETCGAFQHVQAEHKIVQGALHTNVMMKAGGKKEIVRFLKGFESEAEAHSAYIAGKVKG